MSTTKRKSVDKALANLMLARWRLRIRLQLLFPIGASVISYARSAPIYGTVVGICGPENLQSACYTHSGDDGYVIVMNSKTGKAHKCYAAGQKWTNINGHTPYLELV